jgi:predicted metal-binding membrane protein
MSRSGSVQARVLVIGGLLAVAGLAWWLTVARMAGMDAAPGTHLGTIGWFTVTWAAMMAAMMLPSLAPAARVATAAWRHGPGRTVLFASGYLIAWTLAGVAAYAAVALARQTAGLAWGSGGRWLSAGVLILAAVYELSPTKRAFLARCRRAPGAPACRGGYAPIGEGVRAGLCCLGCSWALMAALFALGVMSLTWMALVAVLVTFEKLAPWPRAGVALAAAVLMAIAFGVAAFPRSVPGLVVPAGHGSTASMSMSTPGDDGGHTRHENPRVASVVRTGDVDADHEGLRVEQRG